MIRIKKTALIEENNKFFYQYKAFTGLVFNVIDKQVLDIFECKDGVRLADDYSQFVPRSENDHCLDHIALIGKEADDYEPFLYREKEFTGIAYQFDGDFCIGEIRYIEGINWAEAVWYLTGELEYSSTSFDNIAQSYEWYENGFFKSIDICNNNANRTLEIEFTEKQEITGIDVSVDYINKSPEFEHHLRYHYLVGYTFVEGARIAPRLFASGLGVNDRLFSELQSCAGFNQMETLILYSTSINPATFLSLVSHQNLKKIRVVEKDKENKQNLFSILKELKQKRPDFQIELSDIKL